MVVAKEAWVPLPPACKHDVAIALSRGILSGVVQRAVGFVGPCARPGLDCSAQAGSLVRVGAHGPYMVTPVVFARKDPLLVCPVVSGLVSLALAANSCLALRFPFF